jgi:hypothetical protein
LLRGRGNILKRGVSAPLELLSFRTEKLEEGRSPLDSFFVFYPLPEVFKRGYPPLKILSPSPY